MGGDVQGLTDLQADAPQEAQGGVEVGQLHEVLVALDLLGLELLEIDGNVLLLHNLKRGNKLAHRNLPPLLGPNKLHLLPNRQIIRLRGLQSKRCQIKRTLPKHPLILFAIRLNQYATNKL